MAPELPDVWLGPAPEERSTRSLGLADVYEGPDPSESVQGSAARTLEVGEGLEQIYEVVRRSTAPDDDEDEDGGEGGDDAIAFGQHGAAAAAAPDAIARSAEAARAARVELTRPDVVFMHHVLTPAATIAMVGSLLFFLLDLRSVFVEGSFSLKWMGLCFVVATVLIARYGRLMGPWGYQRVYTVALAAATFVAMAMSPWEPPQTRVWGPLCNALVLWVVWRYATALTEKLSVDADSEAPKRRTLFGLERQALETWRRQQAAAGKPSFRPTIGSAPADSQAVLRSVGVLVLAALAVFAAGEPLLLLGRAEVQAKALSAMVCFFLASAALLAAASTVAQQRRLRALQSTAPWTLVTGRVLVAVALTLVATSLGLQLPGVQPDLAAGERGLLEQRIGEHETGDWLAADAADVAPGPAAGPVAPVDEAPRGGAAQLRSFELVPSLSQVGRLLSWPVLGAAVALLLWSLGAWAARQERLGPALRDATGRVGAALRTAWMAFWRWLRPHRPGRRRGDPLASLDTLRRHEPERAVVGAYALLQTALADLGHVRGVDQTPLEYLQGIPGTLSRLRPAAERLTRLYLLAAYAPVSLADSQRQQAVEALEELRLAARLHADEIRGR